MVKGKTQKSKVTTEYFNREADTALKNLWRAFNDVEVVLARDYSADVNPHREELGWLIDQLHRLIIKIEKTADVPLFDDEP